MTELSADFAKLSTYNHAFYWVDLKASSFMEWIYTHILSDPHTPKWMVLSVMLSVNLRLIIEGFLVLHKMILPITVK